MYLYVSVYLSVWFLVLAVKPMLNHGAILQPACLKGNKGIYPQPRNSEDLLEHIPKDRQVLHEAQRVAAGKAGMVRS